MIIRIPKSECRQLSENFSSDEFDCNCNENDCILTPINLDLIDALEHFRRLCGNKPVAIRRGYSCAIHNERVGGAPSSRHLQGDAVDLVVNGFSGVDLAKIAEQVARFRSGGIGTYRNFPRLLHADVRPNGPVRWQK